MKRARTRAKAGEAARVVAAVVKAAAAFFSTLRDERDTVSRRASASEPSWGRQDQLPPQARIVRRRLASPAAHLMAALHTTGLRAAGDGSAKKLGCQSDPRRLVIGSGGGSSHAAPAEARAWVAFLATAGREAGGSA